MSTEVYNMQIQDEVLRMIQETTERAAEQTVYEFINSPVYYSIEEYIRLDQMMKWLEENLVVLLQNFPYFDEESFQCRKIMLRNHLMVIKSELSFFDSKVLSRRMTYDELNIRRHAIEHFHLVSRLYDEVESL